MLRVNLQLINSSYNLIPNNAIEYLCIKNIFSRLKRINTVILLRKMQINVVTSGNTRVPKLPQFLSGKCI